MDRPYKVRLYYGKDAKHPKRKGDLAIAVENATQHGAQMDVDVGIKREEIGLVTWWGPDWSGEWRESK